MIRLVSVGEFGVGKSSLLVRWKEGKFNPNMTPQLGGIDFPSKEIEIDKVKTVVDPSPFHSSSPPFQFNQVQLWDTYGQERFQSITKMFYRLILKV